MSMFYVRLHFRRRWVFYIFDFMAEMLFDEGNELIWFYTTPCFLSPDGTFTLLDKIIELVQEDKPKQYLTG